jgi:pimeloyl-ACP methyl ester carboxylesterase
MATQVGHASEEQRRGLYFMSRWVELRWGQFTLLATLLFMCNVVIARETVLDRIVHIEERILEVPEVERLEAGLDLIVRKIDVADATLYVEEEGSGEPMILINGGPGGTHHYFHPWFSRAKEYARVIYYDQRGTGLSDFTPGTNGYSVEQAVADLERIRTALGIDQWVLLGYSYGGFLAQYYATLHPEHVSGLILLGAKAGMWVELGELRQMDYISEAEISRIRVVQQEIIELGKQHDWPRETLIRKIIFNNFINGDWKRQHFYKPTHEEVARIARYEWVNDRGFNRLMNRSADRVNLTGAFDYSPFQTLIFEGEWDLTWNERKQDLLAANHPTARFVKVSNAGHGIYSENPDKFFEELQSFLINLKPVNKEDLSIYRQSLKTWRTNWQSSPLFIVRDAGPGKRGSERIVVAYEDDWIIDMPWYNELQRIGFALYDEGRYEQALNTFDALATISRQNENNTDLATALIWQGQMLDLLERRLEAVGRYQEVIDLSLEDGTQHSQYDLEYEYTDYAEERIREPFSRIENSLP